MEIEFEPIDSSEHTIYDLEKVPDVASPTRNHERYALLEPERPRRNQQPLATLCDFEVIFDNAIDNDGEFLHFAMFADYGPINFEEANQDFKWVTAINEEIIQ